MRAEDYVAETIYMHYPRCLWSLLLGYKSPSQTMKQKQTVKMDNYNKYNYW